MVSRGKRDVDRNKMLHIAVGSIQWERSGEALDPDSSVRSIFVDTRMENYRSAFGMPENLLSIFNFDETCWRKPLW